MTKLVFTPGLKSKLKDLLGSNIVKVDYESPVTDTALVAKLTLADGRKVRYNSRPGQSGVTTYELPKYLSQFNLTRDKTAILEPIAFMSDEQAIIYPHIEGNTLKKLFPDVAVDPWFVRMGQLLRAIHNAPPPEFLDRVSAEDILKPLIAKGFETANTAQLVKLLEGVPLDNVCHGDPDPCNWLVDEDSDLLTLIDFSDAGRSSAMHDIAILLCHSRLSGAPANFEEAFWSGYGPIDQDVQHYLKLWLGVVYLRNAYYIETWIPAGDPKKPKLMSERLGMAEELMKQ
ncbi:MAG: aminoglycoside phosphotransferase family protein [Patescibacteria group bacterium]